MQMVQLTAELERSTDKRLKLERELIQTKHTLEIVSDQKNALVKTTEKYQADKRGLEEEVSHSYHCVSIGKIPQRCNEFDSGFTPFS